MTRYETPGPITVTVEGDMVNLRITASDRTDTTVEVTPTNEGSDRDVRTAQNTQVGLAGGRLLVKAPKSRSVFNKSGGIDVVIAVPTGSALNSNASMIYIDGEGRFGDVTVKTSMGNVQIDEVATASVRTGFGDIRVDRASGPDHLFTSGTGRIDLGEIEGSATVKNSNGDSAIGVISGNLQVKAANGRISVGTARANVDAASSTGGIQIGRVERGSVRFETSVGPLEIGIAEGTAAWLDVSTKAGAVRNSLGTSAGPDASKETVEVRGRTSVGDVVIRRA
ncbi:DUF4097 family beta strand repeat-containing protein [Streptomyces indicus]|uniref:Putative adhesin n=1 Tax=Streptomyces indicus TaxID=417292 RepID=A0A1G9CCV5_9ACTN|nr:DUF4097 family beta strand repeat-containing protein [Streptomyces indicus]SDK49255.1 Putative adhesin [Streptomyces indicus]